MFCDKWHTRHFVSKRQELERFYGKAFIIAVFVKVLPVRNLERGEKATKQTKTLMHLSLKLELAWSLFVFALLIISH